MIYIKLKRVWSNNDLNYIPNFKKVFPELNKVSSEELANRFIELGLDFYKEEVTTISPIIRFTLPFAIIAWLLMFILLPLNYIITGKWGYSLGKNNHIYNWLRSLNLQ